ncbi:MAG TPA: malto-oligosyltrehalose trehalohydrolase [Gammaproteobacteria bacterium]|nr:malto-oligosyltrehalose trehalohydrolase [Gammaproteobacteria bacterium]
MPAQHSHDMPYGAQIEDGGVRFRIWAPAQDTLNLILGSAEGEQALPMAPVDDGWFALTTDAATAGGRYCYQLANDLRVPDPASRFQPEDVHGPSQIIDPRAYEWRQTDWRGRPWREAILYETHVGAFTAPGDYDSLRRKLDYLADIGITAVELMPLSDFEGRRNWGYDGVLPFAPDSSYGAPDALKQLIDAAHERGLMMFLDVVYNHFGPSGNYLALYAPGFFTDHFHTPWGDAIDFTRHEVRQFFIHNVLYWLEEYRFDGLRFDAVDQIRDPSETHFLTELAQTVRARITNRHVHLVLENDDNAAHYLGRDRLAQPALFTAQWNDDFHHAAHVIATAEDSGYYVDYMDEPTAALGRALTEGFIYQGERSEYRNRNRGEPSAQLPSGAFVDFIQNHDQIGNRAFGERLNALADAEAVEALTAILLLAPQVPLLFMGEEWGAPQPFYYFCDYEGELADAVREGRRQEFSRFAEFAHPEARERIPDPNAEATFVTSCIDWLASERLAGQRRLEFVSKLLDIRRREIVPRLDATDGHYEIQRRALRVEWTLADGARLYLAANLSPKAVDRLDWTLPGSTLFVHPRKATSTALPPWAVVWACAS